MSCSCATSSTLAPIRAWICRPSFAVTGSMIFTVTVPCLGVTLDIAIPLTCCERACARAGQRTAETLDQMG